jgi:glycosyltransferase involved in cell wall biosynthesis
MTADSKPAVTVGITCFNAEDTIARAVESALAQEWENLEVIVVDDCSKDGSWAVLCELAASQPQLKTIRHEANKGYPSALNTILEHASGKFVAIFDDDDDHVPDRISAQVERIVEYEQTHGAKLVFCYSNRSVVRREQSAASHIARAIGRSAPEPNGLAVADFILGIDAAPGMVWGRFGSCTLMARREVFAAVGPFDPKFRRCAEWDMAIRAAHLGAHFIAVDRPLITQYKTQGADKAGTTPLKYALLLRDKHKAYLDGKGLYHASRLIAHANFHGNKGRHWRSRAFRLLAFAIAPKLLHGFLLRRRARNTLQASS